MTLTSRHFHGWTRLTLNLKIKNILKNTAAAIYNDYHSYIPDGFHWFRADVPAQCLGVCMCRDSHGIMLSSSELSGSMSFSLAFSVLSLNIRTSS